MGWVHSKEEAIDPQHTVNNVHDAGSCFVSLVSRRQTSLGGVIFEVSANPQGKNHKIFLKNALENKNQQAAKDTSGRQ